MISKINKTLKLAKDLKLGDIVFIKTENSFDRIYTHYINPYTDKPNNVFLAFKRSSQTLCVNPNEPFEVYSPDSQLYKLCLFYLFEDFDDKKEDYTWMISEEIARKTKKSWQFNYRTNQLNHKKPIYV